LSQQEKEVPGGGAHDSSPLGPSEKKKKGGREEKAVGRPTNRGPCH